jgi:ribosome biogenesis GTPase A
LKKVLLTARQNYGCGIPNVGKSSFINKLSRRAGAKTGDKPGITQGQAMD